MRPCTVVRANLTPLLECCKELAQCCLDLLPTEVPIQTERWLPYSDMLVNGRDLRLRAEGQDG